MTQRNTTNVQLTNLQPKEVFRCVSFDLRQLSQHLSGFGLVIDTATNFWQITEYPARGMENLKDGVDNHRKKELASRLKQLIGSSVNKKVICVAKSQYDTPYMKQIVEKAGGKMEITHNDEISAEAVRYLQNELKKIKESSHFPDEFWFHAAQYVVDCHNHQYDDQLRQTPAQKFLRGEAAKLMEDLIVAG